MRPLGHLRAPALALALLGSVGGIAGNGWHTLFHGSAEVGRVDARTASIHCDCEERIAAEAFCFLCRPQSSDHSGLQPTLAATAPVARIAIRLPELRAAPADGFSLGRRARAPPILRPQYVRPHYS